MVSVEVLRNSECSDKYAPNPITENMVCAATPGGDACFGDSGGPMTVRRGGAEVLEGVISWGKNCARARWPGVYSRVRKVLRWVFENTRDSEYCERDRPDAREGHEDEGKHYSYTPPASAEKTAPNDEE